MNAEISLTPPGDTAGDVRSEGSGPQGLSYAPYLSAIKEGLSVADGFATREAVDAAASMLSGGHQSDGETRYGVRVGPGLVQLLTHRLGFHSDATDPGEDQDPRGQIVEWSGKSRVNMVRTMCSLDWSPVVDPGPGWRPVMVTLTLPGDWEDVAPDGDTWKRLVNAFYKRWCRDLGRPWAGVWKQEFQRRGAPHMHLYCAAPIGEVERRTGRGRGARTERLPFWTPGTGDSWLARVWYEICGSEDERHLRAGTAVDWAEGIRASDPKRVGIYFLKRSAAHNIAEGKEYQHRVPAAWQGEGGKVLGGELAGPGPGRFWGYRGLEKATTDVELDREQWMELRRLARRWSRSEGRPVRSLETGRVQGGFVLHNDAPAWVSQAARWEALTREQGNEPTQDRTQEAPAEAQRAGGVPRRVGVPGD